MSAALVSAVQKADIQAIRDEIYVVVRENNPMTVRQHLTE
jgi:hypothetical protein